MPYWQVRVKGLNETIRSMERLGIESQEFKASMSMIAGRIANLSAEVAPRRTGALASRVKGSRRKRAAVVYIRRGLRYDHFAYYGSGKGHAGKPYVKFIEKTAAENEEWIKFRIEAELAQIVKRNGF